MKTHDVLYHDGNLEMRGFVAFDETRQGSRPGVLVFHEGGGLGEHAMRRAQMLADLGYIALAADMFGNRRQLTKMDEIMALIGELRASPQKLRARARAAFTALIDLPNIDSKRIGAIGFCFGGTTVLEMARDGADLAGVVVFHGGLETAAPAQRGTVKSRILVCNGADDPMIPPPQVQAFEDEMKNAGADYKVINYPGVVHSFTNPQADGTTAPGILYNAEADRQSWAAMRQFFEPILKS